MSGQLHLLRPYTEWRVKEYTRDAAAAYVAELRKQNGAGMEFGTLTSRRPNRAEELVGGSVYFCKGGVTLFRMPFLRLHPSAHHVWILMKPEVYYVASRHVGMVRGWRYTDDADKPPDLDGVDRAKPAPRMPCNLRETGLV